MTPLAQTVLAIIEEGWHFSQRLGLNGPQVCVHNHRDCEAITKRLLDALKESEE